MADDNIDETNVVGAPLPQAQVEPQSMLSGVGEEAVVTVFNPLKQDFRVQFARSRIHSPKLGSGEQFAKDKANLDLSKTNAPLTHVVQYHVLKAGQTENLPGDIAQIAVRQLVSHILMAEAGRGEPKLVADPFARNRVEKEVVRKTTNAMDFFNKQPVSAEDAIKAEIEELNPAADPPPGQGMSY